MGLEPISPFGQRILSKVTYVHREQSRAIPRMERSPSGTTRMEALAENHSGSTQRSTWLALGPAPSPLPPLLAAVDQFDKRCL